MLFSDGSVSTMIHGIVFGGGTLLALSAAWFSLHVVPGASGSQVAPREARWLSLLLVSVAALSWLAVIGGTYFVFPLYRATPPEGLVDLSQYPRAFLLKNPETAWLHRVAMEIKEHVPWIAAMLASAVAFVGLRYRSTFLGDRQMRRMMATLTAICFVLVASIALLGVFINKVAPVQ